MISTTSKDQLSEAPSRLILESGTLEPSRFEATKVYKRRIPEEVNTSREICCEFLRNDDWMT